MKKQSTFSPDYRYRARIRETMREAGMDQEWLARKIGIRRETFSRKMNGLPFSESEMRMIQEIMGWKSLEGETI